MDYGIGFVEVYNQQLISSSVIISTHIVSGASLNFRYRCQNEQGWSEYSPSNIIVAATVPNAPTQITTQIVEQSTLLYFGWVAPLHTGGNSIQILGYRI